MHPCVLLRVCTLVPFILFFFSTSSNRAMEVKKRAMAEAEEERRRKALEDRRHSQQQATDRFRSTIGRMKFSKPTTAGKKLNFPGTPMVCNSLYIQ